MRDHHVDRPEVEAGQPAQLTGTNRSIGLSVRTQRQRSSPAKRQLRRRRQAQRQLRRKPEIGSQRSEIRSHQGGSPPPAEPVPPRRHTHTTRFRPVPRLTPGDAAPLDGDPRVFARGRRSTRARRAQVSRRFGRPGGHSEGQNTRSHPELGRENPQRRWYCASRRGRVGRRQTRQTAQTTHITNPCRPDDF